MIVHLRRPTVGVIVAALFALCAMAVEAPPSGAELTHQLLSSFEGDNGTQQPVLAAAVDNSTGPSDGDVYFGLLNGTVLKFEADGTYTGVEVTGAETPQGSLSLLSFPLNSGISVDGSTSANAGDLYVADIEHGVVDRFDETGHYICQITGAEIPSLSECDGIVGSQTPDGSMTPRGVAVDPSGDVYVADAAHNVIDKFAPSGEYVGQFSDPLSEPGPLAVDDTTGNIYVANGPFLAPTGIAELEPGGGVVPAPELESTAAASVAVDESNGRVLVGEPGSQISEFERSGAKVDAFGDGGHALAVHDATGDLYANHNFDRQISVYGPLVVLPDDVTTEPASTVGTESATLNGKLTPDPHPGGKITECQFEYGTDTTYGLTAPCVPSPPYGGLTDVSAAVTLAPSTTYHFRLKVTDAGGIEAVGGSSEGFDETLTTPGAPGIDDEAATPRAKDATVRAQVNPFGFDTTCRVQFVDDSSFKDTGYATATTLPCSPASLGAGIGDQGVSAHVSGLTVSTTYHFHFIAENTAGVTTGPDQTFITFGISDFKVEVLNREGHTYTQAGGHPYKLVTNIEFNKATDVTSQPATDANVKDIVAALPPGFIGNINATPKCTPVDLVRRLCSGADQVGRIKLRLDSEEREHEPLYNLVPPPGYPAALGFRVGTFENIYIYFKVRTGGDYGVTAESLNSSTDAGLEGATIEVWGVPADPSHDEDRVCENGAPGCSVHAPLVPFLTDPTSCTGPMTETLRADSWQSPGEFVTASATLPGITGCESLAFAPEISVQPDTTAADAPAGLITDLRVPQDESPEGLAQPELKRTVVELPAGMAISPSAASGLAACAPDQIGMDNADQPACPDASKIGTVEITTPALPDHVKGSVYLAEQNNNPFGSLLAIYVAAEADGALIKLAGQVVADPVTGQLTTTFDNTPQLPFSDFKLSLSGGPHSSLATPEQCGTFSTLASLTPWSGTAPVSLSSPFEISSGCVSGFSPSFLAGTQSAQAGATSPFTLTLSRTDQDQNLSGVSVTMPPGLLGTLKTVEQCPEPQAGQGACGPNSLIGHATVAAGVGPDPFHVQGGQVFLTGPYNGGPFGLSVVVPAVAGPFNLGNVVVRSSIRVDSRTSQITILSDPLPQMINSIEGLHSGIPADVRAVNVTIDRPGFTFNPTNCAPLSVTGTLTSARGMSAAVSSPFQAANCATLPFKPTLTASTKGNASKANGAAFVVKVMSGPGQANIAKTKLVLPIALPSRLTTIQKACPDAIFAANPSSCPEGSDIGAATVHTPLLKSALTGPAYLVSHAAAAFPDVEFVLQGEGITLILDGQTDIKKGITTSTFNAVPDAPVTSFEANLPEGPHSALASNVPQSKHFSLCGAKLVMPTTITGQNGAVVTQQTKIAIQGCARKPLTRAQKLKKALQACKKIKKQRKRAACKAQASKRLGELKAQGRRKKK
ncbi:MAG TPA: NHL repeat-containing protein [Solirubrobacteraceae bacterium]|nr:NHL repeat-containing protein [Solirubrobacteraceae bacterium]